MGKVKTDQIKRVGKTLLQRFPTKFTVNFEENKVLVNSLTQGTTTKVRNQIAGYVTHKVTLAQTDSSDDLEASE